LKRLTDMEVTHISLVESAANKKTVIYKSSDDTPSYAKDITFKKSDKKKGVVYGIVYSPNEEDTQGDIATADEITKAAYFFMKARNTANVDKQHSFEKEDAFVAESWITKENDPVFPDEPVGSWAVAIKLESDELKKAVEDGELNGISMAGTAKKEETQKADDKTFSLNELIDTFKKVFSSTHVNISGSAYTDLNKSKGEENDMKKDEIEKAIKDEIKKEVDPLNSKIEVLEKENTELKEQLKKSKQDDNFHSEVKIEKSNSIGGIL